MPDWRDEIERRLKPARLDGATEADVVDEIMQHLDDRCAELRAGGESEAEAYRMALAELDEGDALGRGMRDSLRARPEPVPLGLPSRGGALNGVWSDLRFGARMLRRAPGFTIVAALVLALGIGANTAAFGVVNSLLLRPLQGVAAPDALAMVYTSDYSGPLFGTSSYPDYESMRDAGIFEGIAVYRASPLSVSIGERSEQLLGEVVSAGYFDVLGVRPALGRFFLAEDAADAGASPAVVISHAFWQSRLNAETDIIGKPLRVNGQMLTIVGVASEEFGGVTRGAKVDAWVPVSSPASLGMSFDNRGNRSLLIIARMREGSTLPALQERLNGLAAALHAEYPPVWTDVTERGRVLTVLPESEARVPRNVRGPVLGMVALLMAVVAIVLLIACSNVASLLLTRASARRSEMGVRMALGATTGRIVRQLLAESVLLAMIGGVAGVLFAVWLTQSLASLPLPLPASFTIDVALDTRVMLFALAVTLLTGVLFGLAPALHGSRSPAPLMREGARGGTRSSVRNALVVVQVAASVVLLVGGALFLRSLLAAQRIDIGFETDNVMLMSFDLRTEGYSPERSLQFFADLQEQVAAIPGVTAATLAQRVPLGGGFARRGLTVDGYTPGDGEDMEVNFNAVGPEYFEVMDIPLARGRGFTTADRAGAPQVVVVNEAFARRFWPGGDAIGKRVGLSGPEGPRAEVVGVVPDGRYRSITEEPLPYLYYPYLQQPAGMMMLHVRVAAESRALTEALRDRVRALAPGMPVPDVVTLSSRVALATMPQRIAAAVLAVLGMLALVIAAIGLYGVVSFVVVQRTREIGIRTALGAASADVARMVVLQGLRLALIGVAIGVVAALLLAQLLEAMLLVSPADPLAVAGAAVLLAGVAVLASWLPARRAARVDPLTALRAE